MQGPQPPTDPMIGTVLGHYKIVAALGAGGMGVVYRATDARLQRNVAIKMIRAGQARDPDLVRRFERLHRTAGAWPAWIQRSGWSSSSSRPERVRRCAVHYSARRRCAGARTSDGYTSTGPVSCQLAFIVST